MSPRIWPQGKGITKTRLRIQLWKWFCCGYAHPDLFVTSLWIQAYEYHYNGHVDTLQAYEYQYNGHVDSQAFEYQYNGHVDSLQAYEYKYNGHVESVPCHE